MKDNEVDFGKTYEEYQKQGRGSVPGWPSYVMRMGSGLQGQLGFDKSGNIYFAGKRLQYRTRLKLTATQVIAVWCTAVSTVIMAGTSLIETIARFAN